MKMLCAFLLSVSLGAGISTTAKAEAIADDAPIRTAPVEPVVITTPPTVYEEPLTINPDALGSGPWLTPKPEQSCSGAASVGMSQGYILPYYGFDFAGQKPVSAGSVSYGCATSAHTRLWAGTSFIAPLTATHGNLGQEEHFMVGGVYHRALGPGVITVSGSVSYQALNRPFVMKDDDARLTTAISYELGSCLQVAPRFEIVRDIPMKRMNILNWSAFSLPVSVCGPHGRTFYVAPQFVHNVNSRTAVEHKNTWYGTIGSTKRLPHRMLLDMGVMFAEYRERDSAYDLFAAADGDGKITLVPKAGGRNGEGPVVGVFMTLTRLL